MYFELDNDDMESSKRRSLFISLIVILKYLFICLFSACFVLFCFFLLLLFAVSIGIQEFK